MEEIEGDHCVQDCPNQFTNWASRIGMFWSLFRLDHMSHDQNWQDDDDSQKQKEQKLENDVRVVQDMNFLAISNKKKDVGHKRDDETN